MEPEQRNKKILDKVKEVTHRDMSEILRKLDRDLVKGALAGEGFGEYFYDNCTEGVIRSAVEEILG